MKLGGRQVTFIAGILFTCGVVTCGTRVDGQAFEVLHTFEGPDGGDPWSSLIQGTDGNFYGTTYLGGDLSLGYNGSGLGTVFRMTPDGSLTTLVVFNGSNGANPQAASDGALVESATLVLGDDGNFYGTTAGGGDQSLNGGYGAGTIFKMAPDGSLTTLVTFEITNGSGPSGPLIKGSDGNFYGTTLGDPNNTNSGTVFQLGTNGALTTLTRFHVFDWVNGFYPSDLVQGSDGDLYGLTTSTLFRLTPTGTRTALLSWNGGPYAGANGLVGPGGGTPLYVTSSGNSTNCGTLFKMTLDGGLTPIVSFNGTNGCGPASGFILRNGNYFGTTTDGGAYGYGTAFQVTPDGKFRTLFSFDETNSPAATAKLMEGSDGNLYGTTVSGGDLSGGDLPMNAGRGSGTIFRLRIPSLPPTLSIAQSGNQFVLSWPTNAVGFTLQSSSNLSSARNWIVSTNIPVIIQDQYIVTNPISSVAQFYRLQK